MKKIITTAAMLGALALGATTASAQYGYVAQVNTALKGTLNAADGSGCLACHGAANNTSKDKGITPFATLWKSTAGSPAATTLTATMTATLATADSDGDGTDNTTEAQAGTSFWGTASTTTTPTSDGGSSGGCVASSATTPLMMVLAMLSLGFFVRRKKD